jgi:hypothetical protein
MKKPILPSEIEISFQPSTFLWGWCVVFSMLVLITLWYCLPWRWSATLTAIYLAACLWAYSQQVATGWWFSVQSLRVDVYGEMTLVNTRGQVWTVNILPDTVVHPWCMVLHVQLQPPSSAEEADMLIWHHWLLPRRLLILPDHAGKQSLSALRVWLRWGLKFAT